MARSRQKHRLPAITEGMTVKNPLAAGIDVGSRFHAVAIPPHLDAEPARQFGCTTPDLHEMAAWLQTHGITTVALESTGNYWVQPVRILEDAGFHVILVHPAYARQAKRTKYSDLDDSVWLQQMHAYGLLPPSFLPPPAFERLRALWRHRDQLIAEQARCIQRMQNALELMNVQLHKAVSDIAGLTGMQILRAIVKGERDPEALVRFRDRRCKCSREELIKALTGDYREEELFVLQQVLTLYDVFQQQLDACDARVETYLQERLSEMMVVDTPADAPPPVASLSAPSVSRQKPSVAPPTAPRKKRSAHEPAAYPWHATLKQLLGVDATRICGFSVLLVLALIAEIGIDLSPWDSTKRFTAWLGLAADHWVTGGKITKRRTRRGKPQAAHIFYMAALAVAKSHTPLGEFYRYQKGRIGPAKALTATARKLAELYYRLLTYGPDFVEQGQRALQEQSQRRKLRKLHRLAQELGVTLVEPAAAA